MSPFRDRRERRSERERARRQARRDELSARFRGEREQAEAEGKAEAKPEATADAAREARRAQRSSARRSGAKDGAETKKPPRQRARRKARAARKKAAHSSAALAGRGAGLVQSTRRAWRRGLRSTRARAKQAGPALRRGGTRTWGLLTPVVAFIFAAAGRLDRALRAVLSRVRALVAGSVRRLDRLLTPLRGILVVAIACAACLVVSQFVDYRGVEIGQPGYVDVSAIASAPRVDVEKAGEAHSYLLIPLAAFAVVMAAVAVFGGRRRAGEAVALAGLAGIAVTLLIDLPKGLDVGLAGSRFSGAHAVLSNGFYAQLAACVGLVICGLALSLNMREIRISARGRSRRSRKRRRQGAERPKTPSLAEGGT